MTIPLLEVALPITWDYQLKGHDEKSELILHASMSTVVYAASVDFRGEPEQVYVSDAPSFGT